MKKLILVDFIRYSPLVREGIAWLLFMTGILSFDRSIRATRLSRALGLAVSNLLISNCIRVINQKVGIDGEAVFWASVVSAIPNVQEKIEQEPHLNRSIILKAPCANGEKGLLLMTFEYNWARLLLGLDDTQIGWLDEHYDLVLSTSWSSTDYSLLALALSRIRGTVFVQSCNYNEIATIESFHPKLKCLPTLPCDWINPDLFKPKPFLERSTDIVMVANWGEFKRHWELFEALADMPKSLKIVLIGQSEKGRGIEVIQALAIYFGVSQELHFLESIPIEEVAYQQCNAKVSLIMTLREGCCVAAVESLFAGCALAMRSDAHVGPLAYINEKTGARLRPGHIAGDLTTLLENSNKLSPRTWAVSNISGRTSWQKVNTFFAANAKAEGKPWTRDIALPQWHPHPMFADPQDCERMRPAYDKLIGLAPKIFNESLRTESRH